MANCVNEECLRRQQCQCDEPQKMPLYEVKSGSDLITVDQSTGTTAIVSETTKLARAVEKMESFDKDRVMDTLRGQHENKRSTERRVSTTPRSDSTIVS